MRYPTSAALPHPPFDVSSFLPPGVNIVSNMMMARFHHGPSALTYEGFYQQVRLHGRWDYKSRIGRQYENFGNFHIGAVGTAAGITEPVLLRAAGWAQFRSGNGRTRDGLWYGQPPYGDDPDDQFWIKCGIDYAKRTGFKKRYVLVPVFFVLVIFGARFHFLNFPVGPELLKKVKVNNLAVLYITQASAGAMTSFSYPYYLYDAKKSDQDFMAHIDDETPFMITSDNNATVTVKDGQVYLHVRGDIFPFRKTRNLAKVHLDASPF